MIDCTWRVFGESDNETLTPVSEDISQAARDHISAAAREVHLGDHKHCPPSPLRTVTFPTQDCHSDSDSEGSDPAQGEWDNERSLSDKRRTEQMDSAENFKLMESVK